MLNVHYAWEMRTTFWLNFLNGRDNSEDLSINRKIILKLILLRFQVLTAASMKMIAFLDISPCKADRRFRLSTQTSVHFSETTLRYILEGYDLREAGFQGGKWINLAQDKDRCEHDNAPEKPVRLLLSKKISIQRSELTLILLVLWHFRYLMAFL
jgi:hypothetical protein